MRRERGDVPWASWLERLDGTSNRACGREKIEVPSIVIEGSTPVWCYGESPEPPSFGGARCPVWGASYARTVTKNSFGPPMWSHVTCDVSVSIPCRIPLPLASSCFQPLPSLFVCNAGFWVPLSPRVSRLPTMAVSRGMLATLCPNRDRPRALGVLFPPPPPSRPIPPTVTGMASLYSRAWHTPCMGSGECLPRFPVAPVPRLPASPDQ